MLVQSVLVAALLAVAAGPVGASMVSMMKEGKLTFCGKQACFEPNICLPFLGVNVCVRTNIPKCSSITCPQGMECALLQDVCESLPCHPKPYCVKHNPCGICLSPDHFCELIPEPVCRHVVEPTCLNKKCSFGETCRREALECLYPPCRVKFSCTSAWPYHHSYARFGKSGDSERMVVKKIAPAVSAIPGVSELGDAFNVFNGFNAKVAKAFIAGRVASARIAGSAGSAGGTGSAAGAGGDAGDGDADVTIGASGAGSVVGAGGAGSVGGTGGYGSFVPPVSAWAPFNMYGHQGDFSTNAFSNFNGFSSGYTNTGGAGSTGGSSDHSSGSQGHFSDRMFTINRPISHAAGSINSLKSVGGSSSAGGDVSGVEPQHAGPNTEEEHVEEEPESESDTEDEDEDEEEEPDQAL